MLTLCTTHFWQCFDLGFKLFFRTSWFNFFFFFSCIQTKVCLLFYCLSLFTYVWMFVYLSFLLFYFICLFVLLLFISHILTLLRETFDWTIVLITIGNEFWMCFSFLLCVCVCSLTRKCMWIWEDLHENINFVSF